MSIENTGKNEGAPKLTRERVLSTLLTYSEKSSEARELIVAWQKAQEVEVEEGRMTVEHAAMELIQMYVDAGFLQSAHDACHDILDHFPEGERVPREAEAGAENAQDTLAQFCKRTLEALNALR